MHRHLGILRVKLVALPGFEPGSSDYEPDEFPLFHSAIPTVARLFLVGKQILRFPLRYMSANTSMIPQFISEVCTLRN